MNFRQLSQRVLEPASQWIMLSGVVFLCQPWFHFLHKYSVTVMLIGLVGFIIFSHIKPEDG